MFDRPSRHSSLETGELVLAQNDLDHAAPASASERARTRCPETADGSIRTSEERRDLVEVYRKPFHRRFERGQGFAKFLGWRPRWVSHRRDDSTSRWPKRVGPALPT